MIFSEVLREAKLELYEAFMEYSDYWWKEEDLQSHLYHVLVNMLDEEKYVRRIHREYFLLYELDKQDRFGRLDLAILEQPVEGNLYEDKIEHTIEMKFPREIQPDGSILTTENNSKEEFAESYYEDYGKLWQNPEKVVNTIDNVTRHILFFEKFDKIENSPFENQGSEKLYQEIRNCLKTHRDYANGELSDKKWDWIEFDEEKFDKTQFSYSEVYREEQESSPVLLHNWNGKPEIEKKSGS